MVMDMIIILVIYICLLVVNKKYLSIIFIYFSKLINKILKDIDK